MKNLICLVLVISFVLTVPAIVYAENNTYTVGQYTLNWSNNDPTFDTNVKQKMIDTFFTVYPQLVDRFNTNASKTVNFVVDRNLTDYPAYASGNTVTFSANWMKNYPNDTDVVTHEIMHVVQSYSWGNVPGWMTEGIADYARYRYGLRNSVQGWSLPAYSSNQSYTDAYRVTARFLFWLEIRIRPNIVDEMDSRLRNGTYSSTAWTDLTGRTVDQLWTQYSQNPSLTGTIVQGGNVALYKTATASGNIAGEEPAKAVGGTIDNAKWCSTNSGDKWLRIDLGQTHDINRWVVKHAGSGGESTSYNTRNFKLQRSSDGYTWTDVDTVNGNTSNVTDRKVPSFTARYLRLYITQAEQNSNIAARIYEFELYGSNTSTAYNVALNKTASASGFIAGENPSKGIDGTVAANSKWCSTNFGDKWLRIDLQKNYSISRWVVRHAGAGGEHSAYNTRNFKLQRSSDGINWVDVDTVTGNTSNVTDRNVTPFTARYIRLYITQAEQSSNTAARIYELEIFGR